MISIEYIIAFAMAVTNVFKKKLPVALIPFMSLILSVVLNILNAIIFKGDPLLAGKEAFCDACIVVGIFNIGTVTRKLAQKKNPLLRNSK